MKRQLPEYIWKRSVLKQLTHRRKDVLPMQSGIDYGRILLASAAGQGYLLFSTSIETSLAEEGKGLIPVLRRVLAAGCKPIGITATLLLPEGTPEQVLRHRVRALEQECASHELELLQLEPCFHTAVREPLLQVTVLGSPVDSLGGWSDSYPYAFPGQSIVMTGWAGLEGTQQLLKERQEAAMTHFPLHFIRNTEQYDVWSLPWDEQRLAFQYGATAMYAAGEKGIFDALWQLGEGTDTGMEIALYQIPIRQETIELMDFFEQNPYQSASGGAFLMVTEAGEKLAEALEAEGIPAAVIGTVQAGRDRVLCFHEERRFLEPYRGS